MDHGGIVSYESNDQFGSSYMVIRPGIHGQLHRNQTRDTWSVTS